MRLWFLIISLFCLTTYSLILLVVLTSVVLYLDFFLKKNRCFWVLPNSDPTYFYKAGIVEASAIAFDTEGFVEFLTPPDNVWTLPLLGHSVCCFLYRAAKKHVWRINECNGHNITFVVDQHQGSCKYRSENVKECQSWKWMVSDITVLKMVGV